MTVTFLERGKNIFKMPFTGKYVFFTTCNGLHRPCKCTANRHHLEKSDFTTTPVM